MSHVDPMQEVLDALEKLEAQQSEIRRPNAWEVSVGLALIDDLLGDVPDDHVIKAKFVEPSVEDTEDQEIPDEFESWEKIMCPECGEVIEPSNRSVVAGIEYEDSSMGTEFHLHIECVGNFLDEMSPFSERGNRHIKAIYINKAWKATPLA